MKKTNIKYYVIYNNKKFINTLCYKKKKNVLKLVTFLNLSQKSYIIFWKLFMLRIILASTNILSVKIMIYSDKFHVTRSKYVNEIHVSLYDLLQRRRGRGLLLKLRYFMSYCIIIVN